MKAKLSYEYNGSTLTRTFEGADEAEIRTAVEAAHMQESRQYLTSLKLSGMEPPTPFMTAQLLRWESGDEELLSMLMPHPDATPYDDGELPSVEWVASCDLVGGVSEGVVPLPPDTPFERVIVGFTTFACHKIMHSFDDVTRELARITGWCIGVDFTCSDGRTESIRVTVDDAEKWARSYWREGNGDGSA